MSARRFCCLILLFSTCISASANAQGTQQSLTDKELLALVAGNALGENIVYEIESRGLAFRATEPYSALLVTAGADGAVLAAVGKAKTAETAKNKSNDTSELLRNLAQAGKLIRAKQYEEATAELQAALQARGGAETGFVIGELLRRQEMWMGAVAIYREVLRKDPDFPEIHTKLAYCLYRAGEQGEAGREAKIALARTPNNAEAHKNLGLVFGMVEKFDAAIAEYREALRLKPDYEAVHYNMGLLYDSREDRANAIAAYKKAIALNPNNPDSRYNLAYALKDSKDTDGAIREYREAKRLAPRRVDARQNLGVVLLDVDLAAAILEFRELIELAPDFPLGHMGLGTAFFRQGDYLAALTEYRKAAELDPSDPDAASKVAHAMELAGNVDEAISQYQRAIRLDPNWAKAHEGLGRSYFTKKMYAQAAEELVLAANLQPTNAAVHGTYAQVLAASGDTARAVSEFKQSLVLDPTQFRVRLQFAALLEKNGDWPEAIEQYRQVAKADFVRGTKDEYQAAQARLKEHLAALRAAGKAPAAAELEARIRTMEAAGGISRQLDAAMEAGAKAAAERRFDDAERAYQEALRLAESMQPRDDRRVTVLGRLGMLYMGRPGSTLAREFFTRQLKASEELYGALSAANTEPLEMLGRNALFERDYASAWSFFEREMNVNMKTFGENSSGVSRALGMMALFHYVQKDFEKAEPFLLRATKIDEILHGHDGIGALANLTALCWVYDKWEKPEKFEPCNSRMLTILEKQYGPNSQVLAPTLTSHARALRSLGRVEEASIVEQRLKTIQTAPIK